jgi:hypothetical protein
MGIYRRVYRGMEFNGNWYGAYWQNLTSSTIDVNRLPADNASDQVSISIWIPPAPPDYDSGWTDIEPGATINFTHKWISSRNGLIASKR